MKATFLLQRCAGIWLLALLLGQQVVQAQGPTIDPTFQPTSVYRPASVDQVLQQPDGKRLALSGLSSNLAQQASVRAGDQPAGILVRLLANSNEPDSVFTRNARSLRGNLRYMVLLPSGKLLVIGYDALTIGNVTRQHLLVLNADGTPDTGFNANLPASTGYGRNPVVNAVGQPDGKVVLICSTYFPATTSFLVRLLPNGSLDTAFQTALSSTLSSFSRAGSNVVLQPDGKLLVPGSFGFNGVIRLLPTGALDATFTDQLGLVLNPVVVQVALQPDGKVLVSTANYSTGSPQPLLRLTDTGALDVTFQSTTTFYAGTAPTAQVQVQPDGRLLVYSGGARNNGINLGPLVRLLPGGGLDTSFTAATDTAPLNGSQLLPNGQILVVKSIKYRAATVVNRALLLNANGGQDASFAPRIYANGVVNDIVQVAGGGYLVAGDFTEINGIGVGNVARLGATGVPDPTFTVAADGEVRSIVLQPDGKLLLGGTFEQVAGSSRISLARVLPSGALDTNFAPPFLPTTYQYNGGINRVAVLPDGRVLAAGGTRLTSASAAEPWLRILDATTGQPDLSTPGHKAQDMVVQPNGKVVVTGFDSTTSSNVGYCVFRLLPSGVLDPTFTPISTLRTGYGGGPIVTSLTQGATGRLYLTGYYYIDAGAPALPRLYSLDADGQGLTFTTNPAFRYVTSLAVQPNGRLLVGADLSSATPTFGLDRVLGTTLAPDPSFGSASRPPAATVNRLLVQPDGAIMVAGSFSSAGGQPIMGLMRLLDTNVLSVNNQQIDSATQAWPVPAHDQLHLKLDAASHPQRVELLDALGRMVLMQAAAQPELTLDTSALPAGVYVLRVQYASGAVSRRIAVE